MKEKLNVFGIRHLSPAASYHLIDYLESNQPKCILIEGPSDANEFMDTVANENVVPPIAILAYTTELPVETILYPFAGYSPEYQAICWGKRNKCEMRFIDLPSNISLKLGEVKNRTVTNEAKDFYAYHNGLYEKIAAHYQEDDYESYWERYFEHNLNKDVFREGLKIQSKELREMVADKEFEIVPYDYSYNALRESYMRREIDKAIADGFTIENIVVIVGAYHVSGITNDEPTLSDKELKTIPKAPAKIAMMPYSYLRLSSRTGYGAGNKAPFYFENMWKAMQEKRIEQLPAIYLSKIAQEQRKAGHNASSANVIEAVRLAESLASMRSGSLPVLRDLHDAAVTCFGGGELAVVAEALNRVDIGTAIGSLPESLGQTPIQENMYQELRRLKLTAYKSSVAQVLELDLRENHKVKSVEAAFIDLNRSTFLHRLEVLDIHFACELPVNQDSATWKELWELCWTPEVEIEIVETNLKGETIELATAYCLKERLTQCLAISEAAKIIREACECSLTKLFENAINTLQVLLTDSDDFKEIAHAARELSILIQYGDIRRFNLEPLKPILQQLFLRASLLLVSASNCDNKAAKETGECINSLELISQEMYDYVDFKLWQNELKQLARHDDLNTILSGMAFSIMLEHNLVSDEDCAKEVSRRLSPGVPADLGAGWFEGISSRNRYVLLSRISLWKELDNYINSLDEEEFYRSLVFLRRAFGQFEPAQKNSIAELLGELWSTDAEKVAEILQAELSEEETKKLNELNSFNFDF
ncbi:MAG: DUF5682 family protein [Prevotellaceae bacterium]|jgi:hypothetical protein|nr:DUF5682 family protein [Prevotellaceae bacterium]